MSKVLKNNEAKWRITKLTVSCDKSNYRGSISRCIGLIKSITKKKDIYMPEEIFKSKEAIKAMDSIIINIIKDIDRNYLDMKKR